MSRRKSPALRLLLVMSALAVVVFAVRLAVFIPQPTIGYVTLPAAARESLAADPRCTVEFVPVEHDPGEERWFDIAGTPYSRNYREHFSYARARVSLTYMRLGRSFGGWIRAEGLKPNFAYQVKLRGNYARDPLVHRALGFLGRWRLPGSSGTNFSDRDYELSMDKSRVESYVLFDFFVTDSRGRALKSFYVCSTLHVLWNDTLNSPWVNRDMPSQAFRVVQQAQAYAPPLDRRVRVVDLWAESQHRWQRSRPPIGQLKLPCGRYRCDVVLTEESFHQSEIDGGGYWATVLTAPVEFMVE